jgi:hypothetical protein
MQEYEKRGRDDFRSGWSRNGKLLSSHQIIATLRCSERRTNQEMASAAKQKYLGFDKMFTYKSKDGSTRVLTSPSAIAKRYMKLHE